MILGGLFLAGSLLPYLLVGRDWGMGWMNLTAPFSFLAESAVGIGPESYFLIVLTSLAAALFWSAVVFGIIRLWRYLSK